MEKTKEMETKKSLYKRIIEFQAKMPVIKKNENNPFYKSKYATLDSIQKAIRKTLTECGLGYTQEVTIEGLKTTLFDVDGNKEEFMFPVNLVGKPQEIGSAVTYAKRYSLTACLGLIIEGEDDDGNMAQALSSNIEINKLTTFDNRPWMTEQQFNFFKDKVKNGVDVLQDLRKYKIKGEWASELKSLIELNKNK